VDYRFHFPLTKVHDPKLISAVVVERVFVCREKPLVTVVEIDEARGKVVEMDRGRWMDGKSALMVGWKAAVVEVDDLGYGESLVLMGW
jgi:hypothetical protein